MTAIRGAASAISFAILMLACSSSSKVETASCSACSGASYTQSDCDDFGSAAKCATSALVANASGTCTNGCSFTSCDSPPMCSKAPMPRADAGVSDAAADPLCAAALTEPLGKGLFATMPTCAGASKSNLNGSVRYTCPCSACPCGFVCGSIKLSIGGTIGSVCAPQ